MTIGLKLRYNGQMSIHRESVSLPQGVESGILRRCIIPQRIITLPATVTRAATYNRRIPVSHVPAVIKFNPFPHYTLPDGEVLTQTSDLHKRSLEIYNGPLSEVRLQWFGDLPYASKQIKGVTFNRLSLQPDHLMDHDIRYYGGGFAPLFRHTLHVSEVLAGLGIASERVMAIYDLKKLPIDGIPIDVQEAKMELLGRATDHQLGISPTSETPETVRRQQLTDFFKSPDSDPAALIRYGGVPWRLEDMSTDNRYTQLSQYAYCFAVTNARLEAAGSNIRPFSLTMNQNGHEQITQKEQNDNEIERYFLHVANFIGQQFGMLHKNNLVHRYASGNIDATGYIMDLDSVKGSLVGMPLQKNDLQDGIRRDIAGALYTLRASLMDLPRSMEQMDTLTMEFARGYYKGKTGKTGSDFEILSEFIFASPYSVLTHLVKPLIDCYTSPSPNSQDDNVLKSFTALSLEDARELTTILSSTIALRHMEEENAKK